MTYKHLNNLLIAIICFLLVWIPSGCALLPSLNVSCPRPDYSKGPDKVLRILFIIDQYTDRDYAVSVTNETSDAWYAQTGMALKIIHIHEIDSWHGVSMQASVDELWEIVANIETTPTLKTYEDFDIVLGIGISALGAMKLVLLGVNWVGTTDGRAVRLAYPDAIALQHELARIFLYATSKERGSSLTGSGLMGSFQPFTGPCLSDQDLDGVLYSKYMNFNKP